MNNDITKKYSVEFALDLPISIDGIVIYPFLLKELLSYYSSCTVIKMDKANINPQYIKMSYYNFLCHYTVGLVRSESPEEQAQGNKILLLFSSLFSLATHKTLLAGFNYFSDKKQGEIKLYEIDMGNYKAHLSLGEQAKETYTLSENKFDEIREILIYQNDIHYINYNEYSKDVQDLLKKEEEKRNKKPVSMTIEDKIDSLMAATGWTIEDVGKLTLRRFERMFERVRKKLEYQIYKTGAMSGLVSFKDKSVLEPWTTSLSFDPLKEIFADYGEVMSNAKKGMGGGN